MDFQYPSEGIHKRWDAGYRITACAATPEQVRASQPASAASTVMWCVTARVGNTAAGRLAPSHKLRIDLSDLLCSAVPPNHCVQAAFVLSIPRRMMADETQETLRTSTFPSGEAAAAGARSGWIEEGSRGRGCMASYCTGRLAPMRARADQLPAALCCAV